MLAMAQSWISLVALAERNSHLEDATTRLTGMEMESRVGISQRLGIIELAAISAGQST